MAATTGVAPAAPDTTVEFQAAPPRTEAAAVRTGSAAAARRRRFGRLRRRMWWLGGAIAAATLLTWMLWPEPLEVDTARVVVGPLETTVDGEGMTRVRDRFEVAAPTTGRLARSALQPGDTVVAGSIVAHIAPVPLDAQGLAQARARLDAALATSGEARTRALQTQEALGQAERSTARLRTVAGVGSITTDALERAELLLASARRDHEAALARTAAAAAEIDAARALLLAAPGARAAQPIRAPVTGTVLRVHEQNERVVAAGTPLLAIGEPSRLEVVVDVLSSEAVSVMTGAAMRLYDWGGAGVLEARVRRVEPQAFTRLSSLGVEEQRVLVIGDLDRPPASLGDGYRVQARIVTWHADDVLKVPGSALFTVGAEWRVFVVQNGRARVRTVHVGRRGVEETEIADGLAAGDQVILFPSDRIAPGSRVRAARD